MSNATCDMVKELLRARELSLDIAPAEQETLRQHLGACASCRMALAGMQDVSAHVESALSQHTENVDMVAARIAAALPPRTGNVWRQFPYVRLDAVAAAVLFAAGLFVGWVLQGGAPDATTPPVAPPGTAPAAPTSVQYVGTSGITDHEVLPDDRLRTSELLNVIIMSGERDGLSVEVRRRARIEDSVRASAPDGGFDVE